MLKQKFTFTLMLLLMVVMSQAQPILQSNVVPNIGNIVYQATADSNSVQPGNPGANLTWNFTGMHRDALALPKGSFRCRGDLLERA